MITKTKFKKIIFTLGAITSIVIPLSVVISCGSNKDKILIELNRESHRISKNEK
jgi:hypothetical protein